MNIRISIYNMLVNRNPTIRYKYHKLRAKVCGAGRIKAWCYLILLNIVCLPGRGKLLEDVSGSTKMEEKNLLLDTSESKWALKKSVNEYAEELAVYDVISFDIFDTLIFRPFSTPTDLFFLVGEKLEYPDFERIRREMEYRARQLQFKNNKNYEITLDDIYALLEKEAGIDRKRGQELEFATELELCMPNPYLQQVFNRLIGLGKQVILVSDMYLEHDRMELLLHKCGYEGFTACYVSSQYKRTKADGSLYRMVSADLGNSLSYVHVGDNYYADVVQAQKAGWHSIHYPNVNMQGEEFRAADMSKIIGSAYRGIVNMQLHNGLQLYTKEYEYGFIYGGLLILGYCHFIHKYAIDHHMDKILFLARDGDILKQVYNQLYPEEETEYVYWSRLAAVKMSAGYFRYDYLRRFLNHKVNQNYTLVQILESMDLTDMAEQMEKSSGLKREDELTDKNVSIVKAFLVQNWELVLEHYKISLAAGKSYFEEILQGAHRVCAVDIGWAGSGAMSLRYLIREVFKLPCELTGIIAGTNTINNAEPDASEAQLQSGVLVSYLYHQGMNRDLWKYHDLNQGDNLYLELLMSSPGPSFKGFDWDENGGVRLLFGEPEKNQEGIREIQRGVLDFAEKYCGAFKEYPYMLNISGRDAYAPLVVAGSNDRVYLKAIYEAFSLKVNL